MFLKASQMPKKQYMSFAYVVGERETLIVKGHVSLGAAQRASRRNADKVSEQGGHFVHGWRMVIDRDRTFGVSL